MLRRQDVDAVCRRPRQNPHSEDQTLTLCWWSRHLVFLPWPAESCRGPNTHSKLMILPFGFPPLTRWKLPTLSRRPSITLKNGLWNGTSQSTPLNVNVASLVRTPIKPHINPNSLWLAHPLHSTPLPSSSALLLTEPSPLVLAFNPSTQSSSPALKHSAP